MAGAFLSEALRQQAMQQVRGDMLQGQIARQVANRIIGQVAAQEIGGSMQRQQAMGKTLDRAAGQQARRDVGRTQMEMRERLGEKEKLFGLIGATASAAGTLGSFLASRPPEGDAAAFSTPTGELALGDFSQRFMEGQQAELVPGVSGQLDTSAPRNFEGLPIAPETELSLSKDYGASPPVSREFKTPGAGGEPQWMRDLPLEPIPSSDSAWMEDLPLEAIPRAPEEGLLSPRRVPAEGPNIPYTSDYTRDSDMLLLEELRRKGLL
jgi:hypothetical protein